jgi:hypothetical protein
MLTQSRCVKKVPRLAHLTRTPSTVLTIGILQIARPTSVRRQHHIVPRKTRRAVRCGVARAAVRRTQVAYACVKVVPLLTSVAEGCVLAGLAGMGAWGACAVGFLVH